jgi:hypothetical protein
MTAMRWFALWMGIGAAYKLGVWYWTRWRYGKFITNVVMGHVVPRSRIGLITNALVGCALWPISIVLMFLPTGVVLGWWPGLGEATQKDIEGRCHECGGPLDEFGRCLGEPAVPPAP